MDTIQFLFGLVSAFRIAHELGFGTELYINLQAFPTIPVFQLPHIECMLDERQSSDHWS